MAGKTNQNKKRHGTRGTRLTAAEGAKNAPDLYKYRSLAEGEERTRTLQIIERNELWYSQASAFNDPFDCNHMIDERSTEEWNQMWVRSIKRFGQGASEIAQQILPAEVLRGISSVLKRSEESTKGGWTITIRKEGREQDLGEFMNKIQERRLRKFYQILDESFGVLSLSEKPDDLLLWSHYANGHDGLCLKLNPRVHPNAFPRLHPVHYQDHYPYISQNLIDFFEVFKRKKNRIEDLLFDVAYTLADGLGSEGQRQDLATDAALGVARWFYVKSTCWDHELEWRALCGGPGPVRFSKRALKGIIVGCVNTEANLELVREAVKGRRPKVLLYKAIKKPREFGLEVVPVPAAS